MGRDEWPDDWAGPPVADEETRRRLDELLSVLIEQRRRDLLYHLEATGVTDVETLAATLAALHERAPPDEVPADVQDQVQTNLVHTHLPKLATVGAIEYDPRSEAIRYREPPPQLQRLVDACQDIEVEDAERDG